MGNEWSGSNRFDFLKEYCEVVFLDRIPDISTTKIKSELKENSKTYSKKNIKFC